MSETEHDYERMARRLQREREARKQAEAIAEQKTRELFEANAVLEKTMGYVRLLQQVAVAANEALTVEEAYQHCLDDVCALTGWEVGHVYALEDES